MSFIKVSGTTVEVESLDVAVGSPVTYFGVSLLPNIFPIGTDC